MFEVFRKRRTVLLPLLTMLAMLAFAFPVSFFMDSGTDPRDRDGNTVVTNINGRDVTVADVERARAERRIANAFIIESMLMAGDFRLANLRRDLVEEFLAFGSTDPTEIEDAIRMSYKADEYGIKVSDDMVRDFLKSRTGGRLTNDLFQGVLRSLNRSTASVSADNIFEILRRQIRIQRVRELATGRIGGGSTQVTPYEAWQFYRKLHDKMKLDVIPVKVSHFTEAIADPGDTALREVFDKYASRLPDPDSPEPGFKVPRKVQVQFASASLEAFLLAMRPEIQVTEEEMKQYYESHKSKYLILSTRPEQGDPVEVPEKPATPDANEEKKEESPTTNETPQATPKPDAGKPESKSSEPSQDTPPNEPCISNNTTDTQDAAQATTAPASEATKSTEKQDASAPSTDDKAQEKSETPKDSAQPPEPPAGAADKEDQAGSATTKDEPKFKPFEEVQEEIAETLARQKARDELLKRLKKVQTLVNRFAYEEFLPMKEEFDKKNEGKKNVEFTPPKPPDLTNEVAALGLKFEQTELIGFVDELPKVEGLGEAVEFAGDSATQRDIRAVLHSADLYDPLEFLNSQEVYFVAWKVADVPEREPSFGEARELVLAAYRAIKAREPAKEQADRIANSLRDAAGDIAAVREKFPEMESISVPSVPLWSDSAPNSLFGPSRVQPSTLPGMEVPGAELRESVFQMKEGEIIVAANQPQNTYYVILLANREAASLESFARSRTLVEMQVRQELTEQQRMQWLSDLRAETSRGKRRPPSGN